MKYIKSAIITSLFALAACEAPQQSQSALKTQITELSQVHKATSKQAALSGNFKTDLAVVSGRSPELLAAKSNAMRSLSMISVEAAGQKLQVVANANGGQTIEDGADLATSKQIGASANVTLKKLIFDGGSRAATIDLAQANAFIATMDTEIVGNKVAKEAAIAWINLEAFGQRDRLLQKLIIKTEEMSAQMETLVASGMIDKSASVSAETALRALVLEEVSLNAKISATSANFIKHFGSLPKGLKTPTSLLTSADIKQVQKGWNNSPIMLQTAAKVLAAEHMLIASKASVKPVVDFKAGLASPMDRSEQTDYAVGLEVNWIIGDGGRRKANIAAQAASLEAAKHALAAAKLAGKDILDTTLSQRAALVASLPILASQEISTQDELEIMWSQLSTGQTSVRQLIEAEEKAYRTSDRKITAGAELLNLDFEILAQSGLLASKLALLK